MKGKIVVIKEVKAVGIVYFGDNMKGEIPELWNGFNNSYTKIKHRSSNNLYYGICDDMPDEQGRFHYAACAEVDNFDEIPEGMEVKIIPNGKYAVYTYTGDLKNLGDFYNSIFSKWMIESGYEIDYRPQFELYDERFMKNGEFDIYVPIK